MRRAVIALVAGLLGITLAVVPPTLAPDQHAHALCYSSISPQCQPGNIPILMNLGIIKPPVTPLPGGIPGYASINNLTGGISQLTVSGTIGALGSLIAGLWMGFGSGGDAGKTQPLLTNQGLQGLLMKTDPSWNAVPEYPTFVNNTNCFAWATSERPTPFLTLFPPPLDCEALDDFEVLLYRVSGSGSNGFPHRIEILEDRVRVTNMYSRPSSGVPAPQLRRWCWNTTALAYNGPTGYTLNMSNAAGNSVEYTFACPAGSVYHGITLQGNFHYLGGDTAASSFLVLHSAVGSSRVAPSGVTAGVGLAEGTFDVLVKCMGTDGPYDVTLAVPFSAPAGTEIQLPNVICPNGDLAVGAGLTVTTPGNPPEVLIDPDLNDVLPDIAELPELYPDCFGPTGAACVLVLEKLVNGVWESCGPVAAHCPTWAQTPEPALSIDFRCKYGTYVIDIGYCSAYRSPSHGVLPNTADDGTLLHPHAPVPGTVGLPLLSPDGTTPWPEGTPWPGTGSGAFPGGGTIPDRVPENCWPEGWGVLNPVSWVFEPVRCALEWAFVPREEALMLIFEPVVMSFATSLPGQVSLIASSWEFEEPPSNCGGLSLDLSWLFDHLGGPPDGGSFNVLDACPGSGLEDMAGWSKTFFYISFTVWGALALLRVTGNSIGLRFVSES